MDGDILEKPVDEPDAVRLLGRLSGRQHTVISSLALVGGAAVAGQVGTRTPTVIINKKCSTILFRRKGDRRF